MLNPSFSCSNAQFSLVKFPCCLLKSHFFFDDKIGIRNGSYFPTYFPMYVHICSHICSHGFSHMFSSPGSMEKTVRRHACHRPRRRPRSGASAQHRGTPRPTKRSPEETMGELGVVKAKPIINSWEIIYFIGLVIITYFFWDSQS